MKTINSAVLFFIGTAVSLFGGVTVFMLLAKYIDWFGRVIHLN